MDLMIETLAAEYSEQLGQNDLLGGECTSSNITNSVTVVMASTDVTMSSTTNDVTAAISSHCMSEMFVDESDSFTHQVHHIASATMTAVESTASMSSSFAHHFSGGQAGGGVSLKDLRADEEDQSWIFAAEDDEDDEPLLLDDSDGC